MKTTAMIRDLCNSIESTCSGMWTLADRAEDQLREIHRLRKRIEGLQAQVMCLTILEETGDLSNIPSKLMTQAGRDDATPARFAAFVEELRARKGG